MNGVEIGLTVFVSLIGLLTMRMMMNPAMREQRMKPNQELERPNQELERLKQENEVLKQENEVLNGTTGILVKQNESYVTRLTYAENTVNDQREIIAKLQARVEGQAMLLRQMGYQP